MKYVILIAFIITVIQAYSALSDTCLEMADYLINEGEYEDAITEYKRFIFFNKEKQESLDYAYYKMGLAYRSIRRWHESIRALRASIHTSQDQDLSQQRRIILSTTLIASGDCNLANIELMRIIRSNARTQTKKQALYFSGVSSLYMQDWFSARRLFRDFYDFLPRQDSKERFKVVDSILTQIPDSYKSIRKAKVMSIILPGLGQIYANDWRNGINAFIINSLGIGMTGYYFHKGKTKTAFLISVFALRFYVGNVYGAVTSVENYNINLERQNTNRILKVIGMDEPGFVDNESE
ncbi:hypothetical protein GF312_09320 [Candidatus Poribacteria bacterium]|nr:hypothetical protein [Candidatus Poribacteria bacterium]